MNARAGVCMLAVAPVVVATAGACDRELPPAGQIVLYVDTDAIVPSPAGSKPDPTMPSRSRRSCSLRGPPRRQAVAKQHSRRSD